MTAYPLPDPGRFYQPATVEGGARDEDRSAPAQVILSVNGPPVTLRWPALDLDRLSEYIHVRLTAGLPGRPAGTQSVEQFTIEAYLPGVAGEADQPLRIFDIRRPVSGQVFEITIDQRIARAAAERGLGLRTESGSASTSLTPIAIWIGAASDRGSEPAAPFQAPHLLCAIDADPLGAFYAQLPSAARACAAPKSRRLLEVSATLHGILDLAEAGIYDHALAAQALRDTLGMLPIQDHAPHLTVVSAALLARLRPLEMTPIGADALPRPGPLRAEDAFGDAYPLAIIAHALNRPDLARQALHLLDRLRIGLWRNVPGDDGGPAEKTFFGMLAEDAYYPNDARALGWYALGMARTLAEFAAGAPVDRGEAGVPPTMLDGLRAHFQDVITVILEAQTAAGLWTADLSDPSTPFDTVASAALTAALVIGYSRRLTNRRYVSEAARAISLLRQYLTPDGLLSGALQALTDGALPVEDGDAAYGVLSVTGMGLLAQALAPSRALRSGR